MSEMYDDEIVEAAAQRVVAAHGWSRHTHTSGFKGSDTWRASMIYKGYCEANPNGN